jgi:hypothetical protein
MPNVHEGYACWQFFCSHYFQISSFITVPVLFSKLGTTSDYSTYLNTEFVDRVIGCQQKGVSIALSVYRWRVQVNIDD